VEKRVIVFLIVSVVIVFAYPYMLRRFVPQGSTVRRPERAREPSTTLPSPGIFEGPVPTGPGPQKDEAKNVVVETDLYTATLSTRGGGIVSWKLKKYDEQTGPGGAVGETRPIDLISESSSSLEYPFSLQAEGLKPGMDIYHLEGGDLDLQGAAPEGSIRFAYQDPDGQSRIIKTYTFRKGTYAVSLHITTSGLKGAYRLSLGPNTGIHSWGQSLGGLVGPFSRINDENKTENPKKIKGPVVWSGTVEIAAQQDKYFLAAVYPELPLDGSVEVRRTGDAEINTDIVVSAADARNPQTFGIYIGPKDYDHLHAVGRHLEDTIDLGWFIFGSWWIVRMIAKPLFYTLKFFYKFSHNYGVAIVLVTCLVKGLFFPISLRGVKSMRAMQELQPKLIALRKKYEKDKGKLNREMIELYREHNINPLGGCLPMLIQLPVFVALFNVLYVSIEMRHAPFVFWIRDLSSSDPFYILPLLYGSTTYLLQKTQPSGMDPDQARMTAIFIPIVTTGLFLNFPSGLVLYWVLNNLLSIGQQQLMGPPH